MQAAPSGSAYATMKPSSIALYALGAILSSALLYKSLRPVVTTSTQESVARPAPPTEFTDISGQTASLQQYRGKVVLLDFWATWCAACIDELPDLKKLHAALRGEDFELLAASLDEAGPAAVRPFATRNAIPWRIAFADEASIQDFQVFGLPTKFLIDRKGNIARKYIGGVDPRSLEQDIRKLLAEKS